MQEIRTVADIVRIIEERKNNGTKIDWSKYFDHIYCLHYLPNKERLPIITKELDRVGILNSGIFDFYFSYPSPFNEIIRKTVVLRDNDFVNERAQHTTNLTIHRCLMEKECVELGYNHVLIIEDDALFLRDIAKIKALLEHMPKDYDFIQFDRAYKNEWYKEGPSDGYFMSDYIGGFTSACCNAYSHKALEITTNILEREFYCIDRLLVNTKDNRVSDLKRFVAEFNIVKQDDRRYDEGYQGLLNFDDFYPRIA